MQNKQHGFVRFVSRLAVVALPLVSISAVAAQAKMPFAEIGQNKITLEVASTPEQIERGLMYRTSLPENQGMVFLFRPTQGVRFWMAHCFISLDMLMIKDGKIVKIFENVPPCKEQDTTKCATYPPADQPMQEVSEVVEVSGGYAKRHGIKEGDTVKFSLGI